VAELLKVKASGPMPGLQSVESRGQGLYVCHWNRSHGPSIAPESVVEVLAAPVGLPLCLGC
jgi:uncharacterized protein YodC (DUF2158 family)